MQRLNLRVPKQYDYTKQSGTVLPRAKFYCVSEGPTEESYFWGIRNNKIELRIKSDVYIEVIEKGEGQESYSHPEQLVNACLFHLGRIDKEGKDIPQDQWEANCKWDYDARFDYVCVIFDRDYRDLDKVLPTIYEKCNRHNIYIAISNPNFELWLLMHFPNIEQYEKKKLLNNPKNLRHQLFQERSTNKKYLEILLSMVAQGYNKGSRIKFERFIDGVPLAIEQGKLFCEDPILLMNELESSVGKLIEKMQSSNHEKH